MNAAQLKAYVERNPGELEALAKDVARLGRPELLPLDLTYESLDRLEDWLLLVLDGKAPGSKKLARERAVRYAGETVIAQAGGRWASGAPDAVVAITGLRALPAARLLPSHAVENAERWRYSGTLRDRLESQDVERQRRTIAALTADLDGTFARLRADLQAFTGADPGPLDPASALGPCSRALAKLNADPAAPRELRRRLREGAAIAMGERLQAELGRAEWTVEEHPRDIDLGAWTLLGVRLSISVARVASRDGPDALSDRAAKMIAARKAKGSTKTAKSAKKKAPRVVAKPRAGRRGSWWVLCSSRRAKAPRALLAKLALPAGATAQLRGSFLVVTGPGDGGAVEVHVALTKGHVVAAESAEVADELCADRPDRDRIAAFDARYELSWSLAESEHAFELYDTLAFRLTDLVQGITVDRVEGKLVEA